MEAVAESLEDEELVVDEAYEMEEPSPMLEEVARVEKESNSLEENVDLEDEIEGTIVQKLRGSNRKN